MLSNVLKFLKSNLVSHSIIYGISGSFVALVPLFLLPFMARALDPSEYGTAIFFSALVTLALPVIGFGSSNAISVRFFQLDIKSFGSYLWSCIFILLISIVIIIVLLFLFRSSIANYVDLPFVWVFLAVLIASLWSISQASGILLIAKRSPIKHLSINLIIGLITIIFTLIALGFLNGSWKGFALSLFIAHLLAALIAFQYLKTEGPLGKVQREACFDSLKFGAPIMVHSIAMSLISYFDRVIISNNLDLEELARYGVAFQLGVVISFIAQAFNKAFVPWLYENLRSGTELAKLEIVRGTYLVFLAILVLTVFYSFLLKSLIVVFAGQQYSDVYPIAILISLGGAFNAAYLMVVNYVFYAGKTVQLGFLSISVAILFILLSLFMVPRFGLYGASYAFLIANFLLFISVWILASKSFSMPWFSRKLFYWPK